MPKAYLTIDDGPSEKFEALVDFLEERRIPAVFFNRGDMMDRRPEAVIYGIKKGYLMANHAYSHTRASQLSFRDICTEIRKTEDILDDLYKRAGVRRPGKYFRFPYLDRGMGPWLVEPDAFNENCRQAHYDLLEKGLGHVPAEPDTDQIQNKRQLQEFLQEESFEKLPAENVMVPWYAETEMTGAIDSLCTFSTSDWALTKRHIGKQGFVSISDLKEKIDHDPWLHDESSSHVILAHDISEIHDVTTTLVDYFLARGFEFLDFLPGNR